MRPKKKIEPAFEGQGELKISGFSGEVTYRIEGDPTRLKFGPLRLKGSILMEPEIAEDAFRAGDGVLVIEPRTFRVTMLGHTTGGGEVFVEMRV